VEAISCDPEIKALAQWQDTRNIEQWRDRPRQRESPGEPANYAETVVDPAPVRRNEVHFFHEPVRLERRLEARDVRRIARVATVHAATPIQAL